LRNWAGTDLPPVEVGCGVVAGDVDHLAHAVGALVVGPDVCEGEHEREVDVDDPRSEPLPELRVEDLPVLANCQLVSTGRLDQVDVGRFLRVLVGLGDLQGMEGKIAPS
jgi:hypothetical protein